MQLRQGDVFLVRISEFPDGVSWLDLEDNRIILAEGEATGHAHAVADEGARLYGAPSSGGDLDLEHAFLAVLAEGGVILAHEEHAPLTIPPGIYEVRRQREYGPEGPLPVWD